MGTREQLGYGAVVFARQKRKTCGNNTFFLQEKNTKEKTTAHPASVENKKAEGVGFRYAKKAPFAFCIAGPHQDNP